MFVYGKNVLVSALFKQMLLRRQEWDFPPTRAMKEESDFPMPKRFNAFLCKGLTFYTLLPGSVIAQT